MGSGKTDLASTYSNSSIWVWMNVISSALVVFEEMDGVQQLGLPILGIVAAAAVTFYVVSFSEIREKSLREYDEREDGDGNGKFKSSLSSRERRARRKAEKQSKP